MSWLDTLDHLVENEKIYCDEMRAINEADEEANREILSNFLELESLLSVIKSAPELLSALKSLHGEFHYYLALTNGMNSEYIELLDNAWLVIDKAEKGQK